MRARSALIFVVALAVAGIFATTASADTYCLYAGDCYGQPDHVYPPTSAGFNAAGGAASGHPGADKIEIGHTPVELTSGVSLNADPTNQLSIEGVGGADSEIHVSFAGGYGVVMNFGGSVASGTLSNVRVRLDGPATGAQVGVDMSGGLVSNVAFDVDSGPNSVETYGLAMSDGAECDYCSFSVSGNNATGARATVQAKIVASSFKDASGADDTTTGLLKYSIGDIEVATTRFVGLGQSILLARGNLNLHDSIIDMGDHAGATGVTVEPSGPTNYAASATIDGVTIVGNADFERGLDVQAETTMAPGEQASASVTNSLFLLAGAFVSEMRCHDDGVLGVGAISVSYTFKLPATPSVTGCTSTDGGGNLDSTPTTPDDVFVDWVGGDLRLKNNAPVIDLGDANTATSNRFVDAIGGQRFVATTGVDPIIDMGGIEYTDYPPDKPNLTVSKTTATVGESIDFDATSFDANNDGPITFTWYFNDGSSPDSSSHQSHAFAAPGVYAITVVAHADGQSSEAAAAVITVNAVAVPGPGPRSDCCSAGAGRAAFGKPSGKFKFKKGAKLKNGFAINLKKPKGANIPVTVTGATSQITLTLTTSKGKALKGKQSLLLPEGASFLTFGGKWNKKPLPKGTYKLSINVNGMPNRISMNVTVAKQGSSGRTK